MIAYWSENEKTKEKMNFYEQSDVWQIGDKFNYEGNDYVITDYAIELSISEIEASQHDAEWRD